MLKESGHEIEIREYLKIPPSIQELKALLVKLKLRPQDIIRKGESVYKNSYKGGDYTDDEWLAILSDQPILIERPIVIKEQHAVVGRPLDNVMKLL